eukprot:scaffold5479_cov199-Amphora_coffeaeformis.AAC.42
MKLLHEAAAPTKAHSISNDKRMRTLLQVLRNSECADCGVAGKGQVKFCSVKLGTFLCNQCYAAHRALGAHITRVKCIGLEGLNDAEIDLLNMLGNARVNVQYEASMPRTLAMDAALPYEKKAWYVESLPMTAAVVRATSALDTTATDATTTTTTTTTTGTTLATDDPFGLFDNTAATASLSTQTIADSRSSGAGAGAGADADLFAAFGV